MDRELDEIIFDLEGRMKEEAFFALYAGLGYN